MRNNFRKQQSGALSKYIYRWPFWFRNPPPPFLQVSRFICRRRWVAVASLNIIRMICFVLATTCMISLQRQCHYFLVIFLFRTCRRKKKHFTIKILEIAEFFLNLHSSRSLNWICICRNRNVSKRSFLRVRKLFYLYTIFVNIFSGMLNCTWFGTLFVIPSHYDEWVARSSDFPHKGKAFFIWAHNGCEVIHRVGRETKALLVKRWGAYLAVRS